MAHFGAMSSITLPPIVTPTLDHCMPMQQLTPPPLGPVACLQHLQPSPVTMSHGVLTISGAFSMASRSPPVIAPLATEKTQPMKAPKGAAERGGSGDDTVTLFPRRKAGQSKGGGSGPVVLTLELLEQFYGMPLHVAARRLVRPAPPPAPSTLFACPAVRDATTPLRLIAGLVTPLPPRTQGICQTAIKKVCRRLGIKKWPYKETRVPSQVPPPLPKGHHLEATLLCRGALLFLLLFLLPYCSQAQR